MKSAEDAAKRLIELASTIQVHFNTVEHVTERGFRAVARCHRVIEDAEQDLMFFSESRTLSPKIAEALLKGIKVLRAINSGYECMRRIPCAHCWSRDAIGEIEKIFAEEK